MMNAACIKKLVLAGTIMMSALFWAPFCVLADSYGDKAVFNIDKFYDAASRSRLAATLIWSGDGVYFYADDEWWGALAPQDQTKYNDVFRGLDSEFTQNIRPKLTAVLGSDVNPAVNLDGKIVILLHPMAKDAGGYINTADGYSKYEIPVSNARQMVYFNTRFIDAPLAKAYLAHEFTHLITFNQKDRLRGVSDDVWLNEARADYSSTILGYDNSYAGSNFEQRVKSFLADSSKSLVVWANKPANYGAAHLFIQYLVEQYGIEILSGSMATDLTGIESIDYALRKRGAGIIFEKVFRNWLVALTANDCNLGPQYCYKLPGLRDFNVAPRINYLPNSDQVSLSVLYNTDYFSGSWQKIVGGSGDLFLDFSGGAGAKFTVPYLLCYAGGGECEVDDLEVDGGGKATLNLPDFGRQYASLTLMPFAAGKTSRFDDYSGGPLPYSFKAQITPKSPADQNQTGSSVQTMAQMLETVESLKAQIVRLRTILAARQAQIQAAAAGYSCQKITADLYFGVENYRQVYCLQQVLKNQGSAIYPQGALTGRFSADTRAAVIRFQEKYFSDILAPYGFKKGTGYVGPSTKAKINQLLLK